MKINWFKKTAVQRFGYPKDQAGIYHRFRNEEGGWDEHLENAKNFILEQVDKINAKKICILGSGWLLDVPFDVLVANCSHLYLVDIIHPPQVVHLANKYDNVTLIEQDITGGLVQEIDDLLKSDEIDTIQPFPVDKLNSTPKFGIPENEEIDLVISLNLLNQLDILICDHLIHKVGFEDAKLFDLRLHIQQSHIAALPLTRTVLISDMVEYNFNNTACIQEKKLVYASLPKAISQATWEWKFDHSGNYHENTNVSFNVLALHF